MTRSSRSAASQVSYLYVAVRLTLVAHEQIKNLVSAGFSASHTEDVEQLLVIAVQKRGDNWGVLAAGCPKYQAQSQDVQSW